MSRPWNKRRGIVDSAAEVTGKASQHRKQMTIGRPCDKRRGIVDSAAKVTVEDSQHSRQTIGQLHQIGRWAAVLIHILKRQHCPKHALN